MRSASERSKRSKWRYIINLGNYLSRKSPTDSANEAKFSAVCGFGRRGTTAKLNGHQNHCEHGPEGVEPFHQKSSLYGQRSKVTSRKSRVQVCAFDFGPSAFDNSQTARFMMTCFEHLRQSTRLRTFNRCPHVSRPSSPSSMVDLSINSCVPDGYDFMRSCRRPRADFVVPALREKSRSSDPVYDCGHRDV